MRAHGAAQELHGFVVGMLQNRGPMELEEVHNNLMMFMDDLCTLRMPPCGVQGWWQGVGLTRTRWGGGAQTRRHPPTCSSY